MKAIHPIAELVPFMTADAESALRADIERHGLKVPVVMFQGMVLDGRHRCRAWRDIHGSDDDIPSTDFEGDTAAAIAFVRSHNIRRRHLTTQQVAFFESQAARFTEAKRGRPKKNSRHSGNFRQTQVEIAEQTGVSVDTIARAAKAVKNGVPEVARMLRDGKVSVSRALKVSKLPKSKQLAALAKPARRPRDAAPKPKARKLDPLVAAFNRGVEAAAKFVDDNALAHAIRERCLKRT